MVGYYWRWGFRVEGGPGRCPRKRPASGVARTRVDSQLGERGAECPGSEQDQGSAVSDQEEVPPLGEAGEAFEFSRVPEEWAERLEWRKFTLPSAGVRFVPTEDCLTQEKLALSPHRHP